MDRYCPKRAAEGRTRDSDRQVDVLEGCRNVGERKGMLG